MIMAGETIVYGLSNWVNSQNHNQRSDAGVGTHWSDCFSNNLRYSLMNCLLGYVAILLNHCYKRNYKFKIILSNNKPHYSLFLLILKYPSLHATPHNLQFLSMMQFFNTGLEFSPSVYDQSEVRTSLRITSNLPPSIARREKRSDHNVHSYAHSRTDTLLRCRARGYAHLFGSAREPTRTLTLPSSERS